jgi:hypothetical protein
MVRMVEFVYAKYLACILYNLTYMTYNGPVFTMQCVKMHEDKTVFRTCGNKV